VTSRGRQNTTAGLREAGGYAVWKTYVSPLYRVMFGKIYDKSLMIFSSWKQVPDNLHTKTQWKRLNRMVRKGEEPVALVQWEVGSTAESERYDTDGTITISKRKVLVPRQAALYAAEQTAPYQATLRTQALDVFREYFVRFTSREHHIWWSPEQARWLTCQGPLRPDQLRDHLNGKARHGVRGGFFTRFGGIDLDLHDGDPEVFLEQFRVLLTEFHGQDGWHFQVENENAGGVHLIQAFRGPVLLASYRMRLRQRLERLDEKHPELAARARAAGMKTLAELEIYPDTQRGFRLPLCEGRTMLLEKPLELIFDKRLKRLVPNVVRYITWLTLDEKPYMPVEDVFNYVKARLKIRHPVKEIREQAKGQSEKSKNAKALVSAAGLGSLGKMKNRFASVLVNFWSGRYQEPDTLNIGIRLLALTLPYYKSEDEAIELIESYIDDLPDCSFSDRLTADDRGEVSRIVRNTVRQANEGNAGQPDPELSKHKLKATVAAWQQRGFDPTDKNTWDKASSGGKIALAKDFCWKPEEVIKLRPIQKLLNCNLQTTSDAVKHFVRLVKGHAGEIAVPFAKRLLEGFGINCGHHGKVNKFLALLRQWEWIRVTVWERWHERRTDEEAPKGRARTYVVGDALKHKYEETQSSWQESGRLSFVTPHRERGGVNLYITSHRSSVDSDQESVVASLLPELTIERNKGSPY
jgi:hypothetical protein